MFLSIIWYNDVNIPQPNCLIFKQCYFYLYIFNNDAQSSGIENISIVQSNAMQDANQWSSWNLLSPNSKEKDKWEYCETNEKKQ